MKWFLVVLFAQVILIARSQNCTYDDNGPKIEDYTLSENYDTETVTQNQVIGFQCNIELDCLPEDYYSENLQICIDIENSDVEINNYFTQNNLFEVDTITDYLDKQVAIQHNSSMVEIVKENVTFLEKFINLRVVTGDYYKNLILEYDQDNEFRDKEFVALIPNGSTIFCVRGPANYCSVEPIVDNFITKYVITAPSVQNSLCTTVTDPGTIIATQTQSLTPNPTSSVSTSSKIKCSPPSSFIPSLSTAYTSSEVNTPTSSTIKSSTPSVLPVTLPLSGALGSFSLVLIIIIVILVIIIIMRRPPATRTQDRDQTTPHDGGRGYELTGPGSTDFIYPNDTVIQSSN